MEIPGIGNQYFLRTALNALRKSRGQEEVDAADFLKLVREKARLVEISDAMLKRAVNDRLGSALREEKHPPRYV